MHVNSESTVSVVSIWSNKWARLNVREFEKFLQEIVLWSKCPHGYLPIDWVLNQTNDRCIQNLLESKAVSRDGKNSCSQSTEIVELEKYDEECPWIWDDNESNREETFNDVVNHLKEVEHDHVSLLEIRGKPINDSAWRVLIEEGHLCIDQTLHNFIVHIPIDAHENETANEFSKHGNGESSTHDDYQALIQRSLRSSIAILKSDS